jgi:hypothetical protein
MHKGKQEMQVQVESPQWGVLKLQLNVTYVMSTYQIQPRVQDFAYTIVNAKDESDTTIILSIEEKIDLGNQIGTEIIRQL